MRKYIIIGFVFIMLMSMILSACSFWKTDDVKLNDTIGESNDLDRNDTQLNSQDMSEVKSAIDTLINDEHVTSKFETPKMVEAYSYLFDNREKFKIMKDSEIKSEIYGDFYYCSLNRFDEKLIQTTRYLADFNGNNVTEKMEWESADSKPIFETSHMGSFSYKDSIVTYSQVPYVIRKISEGYYIFYSQPKGSRYYSNINMDNDYVVPTIILIKGTYKNGFVPSNSL